MKTKHHSHRGLSRLVAILLCALCVIGLFPMSAFALEPGTKASSWMGDQYLASDGDTYYHPAPWYSMTYHEDGSTSYVTHGGGAPYNHYMLTDSSGVTHTVYCIESGIDYGASDNAWLMLPEVLAYGNYELYEVAAPYGYVLSGEAIPFTVDGSETVVTVTQYNMPQKGQITISKTGEVFFSVQENEGLYQPVYEIKGLPGASYDLIADEDIYTGDGTLRVEKDTVVETLTTGNDGIAESGLLYLGKYRLEEREAPYGCVLNEKPEYVELSYAGETVEVTEQSISLYDERQKAGLDLTKAMEKDELFKIGDGEEYKDVSFGLYAAKELVAVDGTVIPEHGLLEAVSIVPNEDGNFTATATIIRKGVLLRADRLHSPCGLTTWTAALTGRKCSFIRRSCS